MRAVHVLFYRPQPDDFWLNHVVTFVSPPYSHCDLQFDDGTASSIYQNECVYMEKKSFSRNNYFRVSLTFSDEEYAKIHSFCTRAHASKVGFDLAGMLCCYMPLISLRPEGKTFCSRYVWEALQASGRKDYLNLNSARVSPSRLHAELVAKNTTFLHISEKRMLRII